MGHNEPDRRSKAVWPRSLWCYGLAVLLVALTIEAKFACDYYTGVGPPLILFVFPVLLAGWHGGQGPGLLATALSALACAVVFFPPFGSVRIDSTNETFRLVLFIMEGMLASRLMGLLHRSNLELALAYDATIEGWSRALDLRDKETEGHSQRVAELTVRMARSMGMSESELVHVRRGALLHDIGKMGIPDAILLKPGPLKAEERAIMNRHPEYAYDCLSPITFLRPALEIPYCHHERWDGTGYPRALKGQQIPLSARIFAAADISDALSSVRPYRGSWPRERVVGHIRSLSGTHLDPEVVAAFLRALCIDDAQPALPLAEVASPAPALVATPICR
jgi:putative nucleotidyltransferase with HDIG domain